MSASLLSPNHLYCVSLTLKLVAPNEDLTPQTHQPCLLKMMFTWTKLYFSLRFDTGRFLSLILLLINLFVTCQLVSCEHIDNSVSPFLTVPCFLATLINNDSPIHPPSSAHKCK